VSAEPARIGGEIRLVGLGRSYDGLAAVSGVDLVAHRGEILTLLGASGSGKTTTLMMIAGFVTPSEGDILLDDRSVLGKPPDKRNLGVVFQSYALFPHMSVVENVAFPLRMRGLRADQVKTRSEEALDLVHLGGLGARRIHQLSGGQQQRVALARALVFRPPVLLMDEPLGALDRKLREQMQLEIKRIQRSLGITILYVTHDQEEALILSDRIAIMHQGRVQQVGTPEEVYERPATSYVASFLGESNFLQGILSATTSTESRVELDCGTIVLAQPTALPLGSRVQIMVRPEQVFLIGDRGDSRLNSLNSLAGAVEIAEYLGQMIRYFVRAGNTTIAVREPRRVGVRHRVGDRVELAWAGEVTTIFPA
jgi:putative spermidine/putrescine transport system ATP-binding protein